MLLELPGLILSGFLVTSFLNTTGTCSSLVLGALLANSLTFRWRILIKSPWKMLLELPDPIPSGFLIILYPDSESMENVAGAPWSNSLVFLYQIRIKTLWPQGRILTGPC